jgi:hypothetical protein
MRQSSVARYLGAVLLLLAACPGGAAPPDGLTPPPEPRPSQAGPNVAVKVQDKTVALTPTADVAALRCTPCRLLIHANEAARIVRVDLSPAKKQITVQADSSALTQVLPIDNPLDSTDAWELGTDDINFDGYADLYLVTSRGSVNEFAHYFRYVPERHTFEDIGTFPVFKLDRSGRRLSTYVKNGSAGLDHESGEYTIVDGKPLLVRQERQSATDEPFVFLSTVRERVDGELKIVAEKQVHVPAPE